MKVAFICTGNTCRSPMAEYLFKKLLADRGLTAIEVTSAGLSPPSGVPFPREAQAALKKEGVHVSSHRPRGVDEKLLEASDLVLTMEGRHQKALLEGFPQWGRKIHLLKNYAGLEEGRSEIADPIGQPQAAYDQTLADIKESLLKLIRKL